MNHLIHCLLNVYHGSVTLLLSINKEESESDQGNTEVVNKLGKDMSWAQNFEYTLGINTRGLN